MENKSDVIIIGGGLAGLSLSILLANRGRKVLILEKETYPFHKVCGEYLSMQSMPFLERIGLDLKDISFSRINRLKISSANGSILEHTLKPGGFGISRYLLEERLYKLAKEKGVIVIQNAKADSINYIGNSFKISSGEKCFFAAIAIGAFGKRSNIDRELNRNVFNIPGKKNHVAVKYHVKGDLPKNVIEIHHFKGGYCGISAIEDNKYCLCYLTTSDVLKKAGGTIQLLEKKVLACNPFLNRYFDDFEKIYSQPLVISNIDFSDKDTVKDHMLMAGDAAGLITPLCGNGMSMAFHSSVILASLIESYFGNEISREIMERRYSNRWNNHFGQRIKIGRILQNFSQINNLIIPVLKTAPFLTSTMIKQVSEPEF